MIHTTDVEKVILVSTIPSNLALDAPVNEEKKKFNLIETDKNLTPTLGYSLGFQKIEGTKTPNVIHHTRREGLLVTTIPSNLALDAPVNEEKKIYLDRN